MFDVLCMERLNNSTEGCILTFTGYETCFTEMEKYSHCFNMLPCFSHCHE